MPNRDLDNPQDPLAEDEDLVGTADEEEDEEAFDEEEDEDDADVDEEALSHADFTAEVGSEGGSPGEAVELEPEHGHIRAGDTQGSEATETWRPAENEAIGIDRRDRRDRGLVKDAP